MADQVVLLDTSILIDYYRKTDKTKSVWIELVRKDYEFAISTVTKYEIYSGATLGQLTFWNSILKAVKVLPFDEDCVDVAVRINTALKRKRKQIGIADLFIAATAINHQLRVATLNQKHFARIDDLEIVQ